VTEPSPSAPERVDRRDGATPAERYLGDLCERTFLSVWSYSGLYRDQGKGPGRGVGKELADLLVVFEHDVIVFSDKHCSFPDTGNIDIDWPRWFRRSVLKSAQQVWGAERWLRTHSDRVFLDPECTKRFPITIPATNDVRFHRIVVAHGSSRRCAEHFGGGSSGSFMIVPAIVGDAHLSMPFTVGLLDPTKGYVHVLDDTALWSLLTTLDTVSDFVAYLARKERFIQSERLISAAGEEDLLAFYLRQVGPDGIHDFVVPPDSHAVITEGMWHEFSQRPERLAQLEADKVSYAWDALIEKFNGNLLGGTLVGTTRPGFQNQERMLRFLAREPRTRRRMLARTIIDLLERTPSDRTATRIIAPSHPGDPYYVLVLCPVLKGEHHDAHRGRRRNILEAYCLVTKLRFPEAKDIVGLATESGIEEPGRSEDLLYFDAREWSPDLQREAQRLHQTVGLLKRVKMSRSKERTYPLTTPKVGRNRPCPCGSGRRFKNCCGRVGRS